MQKFILHLAKIMFIVISCFIVSVGLYLFAAYSFALIIVDKKAITEPENISIFLLSNGVHTDVVVPTKNNIKDWSTHFKYSNTRTADSTFQYLAIGWGDKGFYLEIPTWDDLTPRIALRAGLGLGSSAIHASYYRYMYEDDMCKKLTITSKQYHVLVEYVEGFLKRDGVGYAINIETNALYGDHDAFYEAQKSYNIFYTCNTWTNNLLKACGQKACLWAPFSSGIMNLYK